MALFRSGKGLHAKPAKTIKLATSDTEQRVERDRWRKVLDNPKAQGGTRKLAICLLNTDMAPDDILKTCAIAQAAQKKR